VRRAMLSQPVFNPLFHKNPSLDKLKKGTVDGNLEGYALGNGHSVCGWLCRRCPARRTSVSSISCLERISVNLGVDLQRGIPLTPSPPSPSPTLGRGEPILETLTASEQSTHSVNTILQFSIFEVEAQIGGAPFILIDHLPLNRWQEQFQSL
jgi:hypothetical protein